jgi:hypothetical protein
MKIAVITGLSGIREANIQDPINGGYPNTDYYAFVDRQHDCKIWQQKPILDFSLDSYFYPRRNAKLAKILGFLLVPGYDYYIWHDHHCDLQMNPQELIDQYVKNKDMAVWRHAARNCVYDEIDLLGRINFDTDDSLTNTLDYFNRINWPRSAGLFELTSLVYANTPKVQAALLTWWEFICKYSSRDQLSFPLIAKKHRLQLGIMPGSAQPYGGSNSIMPIIRDKNS